MRKRVYAATALLLAPITAAAAQNPADLVKCATIARDAERLACYDAAVADSSAQARAASQIRARESARIAAEEAAIVAAAAKAKAEADAVALAAAQKAAFGAEGARSAERFAPRADEIQEIAANITETLVNRSAQNVFLLDNGQMWRQVDAGSIPNVRTGDSVVIARAGLGGYHLKFVRQKRQILVKRLR